jgi:hypothetical protein
MPPAPILTQNTLFYGDNLDILREYIASESDDVRDLRGTVEREGAAMDVFITLQGIFDL